MYQIIKSIKGFFTNTIYVDKKDLEINTQQYKKVVFSVVKTKDKKDWFELLHLFFLKNRFNNEQEMLMFLDEHKINKDEFEKNIDSFMIFHSKCNERYSNFLLAEIKHMKF